MSTRSGRTRSSARRGGLVPLMVPRRSGLYASPEAFWNLCAVNDEMRLERSARGEVIAMWPAGADSGMRNADLTGQLHVWSRADGTGVVFDSNAGFTLLNGAVRAPDASWIARNRWLALPKEDRLRFAPICPDFVVELVSPSDVLANQRKKMREYLEQGARLGWLLDPRIGLAEVYRPGDEPESLDRPANLSGEGVLPGFVLDLRDILSD